MAPFQIPIRVARVMAGFDRPWYVAGGWAVDLHLGRVTRPHKDIEIAIFRRDQARIRARLSRWSFRTVVDGRFEPWKEHVLLEPPVHEVHARGPGRRSLSLEILLNDMARGDWAYRRNPTVRRPLGTLGRISSGGIPYLVPEVVLLFKAKSPGAVDELDFHHLAPSLDRSGREWLRDALSRCHPGHPWIARLSRVPEKL